VREVADTIVAATNGRSLGREQGRVAPRDAQRTFRLVLATVWLTDAVLQIQPFMFTRGSNGLGGMLHGMASGNPGFVARTITWNASIVAHEPVVTNALFALIQFVIAFGIVYPRTVRPALALSMVWALGVWWFGEGAGGVFLGASTPFGGGPGGVLYYAVLAVLLWPRQGSEEPFVAARAVGVRTARLIWVGVWGLLAVLTVVGSGRSPKALHDLVTHVEGGQPGWLTHIDRVSAPFLLHHGTTTATLLAAVCVVAGASIYLAPGFLRLMIVVVCVAFAAIWIAVENLGGILAGGATDPNSGPLVILLALLYWPSRSPVGPSRRTDARPVEVAKA
jgi:hypothetical protein